jgi:hypothetical protein
LEQQGVPLDQQDEHVRWARQTWEQMILSQAKTR